MGSEIFFSASLNRAGAGDRLRRWLYWPQLHQFWLDVPRVSSLETSGTKIGHAIGLINRYVESPGSNFSVPNAGYETNLMGRACCGNRLSRADIIGALELQAKGTVKSDFKIRRLTP